MDSQSVKNTDSAENKGYDAGKKVSGIKRHIAVDTQGLPHAIHVTTANVTDRAGALAMFDQRGADLRQVQKVLVDGGYTGKPFATAVQSLLGASVEVVKRNELHTFVVLPKRWVVERSFAWLQKCRRLWKNCERKLNTSLQMVVLAFTTLILKDCEQVLRHSIRLCCPIPQSYRHQAKRPQTSISVNLLLPPMFVDPPQLIPKECLFVWFYLYCPEVLTSEQG